MITYRQQLLPGAKKQQRKLNFKVKDWQYGSNIESEVLSTIQQHSFPTGKYLKPVVVYLRGLICLSKMKQWPWNPKEDGISSSEGVDPSTFVAYTIWDKVIPLRWTLKEKKVEATTPTNAKPIQMNNQGRDRV